MQLKKIGRVLSNPRYIGDLLKFRRMAKAAKVSTPEWRRLQPITNEATTTTGFDTHYVYHTGWASRILARTRPEKHIDIGSALYFVSNASAIVPIVHYDYRPPNLAIPGVEVGAADLLALDFEASSIPSLSCMHVVEHVGLGRYGDTIDPQGDRRACAELSRVLAPGGQLLFVTPVGEPMICFNAHRVYGYDAVLAMFPELELVEFALITDRRDGAMLVLDADPERVKRQRNGCGCFLFRKKAA